MANKGGGPSKVGQALNYKNSKRWSSNRQRKLMKLFEAHPNNRQIEQALEGELKYRRRTPTVRFWSSTRRRTAQLFKRFKGVFHPEVFSNNEKVSIPALLLKGPYSDFKAPPANEKTMFSLGARVHTKGLQWR